MQAAPVPERRIVRIETVKVEAIRDCYRIALNAAQALAKRWPGSSSLPERVAVVHGTILPRAGSASGRRIAHAWVELDEKEIVDRSSNLLLPMPKADYLRKVDAVKEARYSVEEALTFALKTHHWGPWHDEE